MNDINQTYVKERLGHLEDLIKVDYQPALIQALARAWDATTLTFNFKGLEIAPTLKEYTIIIGMDFKDQMMQPPLRLYPSRTLSKFLRLKSFKIEEIFKLNSSRFSFTFLYDNYSQLSIEIEHKDGIFILTFFGFVLFPSSRVTFDPLIAFIAQQACYKWNYSYMILDETFLSLNRFKSTRRVLFKHLMIFFTSSLLHTSRTLNSV